MTKKLFQRRGADNSERVRQHIQFAFFPLNIWIAGAFYFWGRPYEAGGPLVYVYLQWIPLARGLSH